MPFSLVVLDRSKVLELELEIKLEPVPREGGRSTFSAEGKEGGSGLRFQRAKGDDLSLRKFGEKYFQKAYEY